MPSLLQQRYRGILPLRTLPVFTLTSAQIRAARQVKARNGIIEIERLRANAVPLTVRQNVSVNRLGRGFLI